MPKDSNTGPGAALGVSAVVGVVLVVVCCAGPVLLAGGLLAVIGRFAASPWMIGAGVALGVGGLVTVLAHRGRGRTACCDPPAETGDSHPVGREGE
jgi:mercuric ion transport protein